MICSSVNMTEPVQYYWDCSSTTVSNQESKQAQPEYRDPGDVLDTRAGIVELELAQAVRIRTDLSRISPARRRRQQFRERDK